jgi:hypothetical protein
MTNAFALVTCKRSLRLRIPISWGSWSLVAACALISLPLGTIFRVSRVMGWTRRTQPNRLIEAGVKRFAEFLLFFHLLRGKRNFQGFIYRRGVLVSNLSTRKSGQPCYETGQKHSV